MISNSLSNLWCGEVVIGGAGGIRTLCLFNAIEALSQLSYSPDNTGLYIRKSVAMECERGLDERNARNRKIVAHVTPCPTCAPTQKSARRLALRYFMPASARNLLCQGPPRRPLPKSLALACPEPASSNGRC